MTDHTDHSPAPLPLAVNAVRKRFVRLRAAMLSASALAAVAAATAVGRHVATIQAPPRTLVAWNVVETSSLAFIATFGLGFVLYRVTVRRAFAGWTRRAAARYGVDPRDLDHLGVVFGERGTRPEPGVRMRWAASLALGILLALGYALMIFHSA